MTVKHFTPPNLAPSLFPTTSGVTININVIVVVTLVTVATMQNVEAFYGGDIYKPPTPPQPPPPSRHHHHHPSSSSSSSSDGQPIIKVVQPNVTVGPGEKATMKCKVENLGTKTLTWRKENEVHPLTIGNHAFAPDARMNVDHNTRSSEWSLSIMDVKPSDEGIYRCQISTKNGNYSQQIRLNVKTIKVTGDEYLESGNTIKLMCNVTGKPDPPHNLEWFKGDQKLTPDATNGLIITKKIETRVLVSLLTIANSKVSDSGEYMCQSSNQESSSVKVIVIPMPLTSKQTPINERHHTGFFFGGSTGVTDPPSPSLILVLLILVIVTNAATTSITTTTTTTTTASTPTTSTTTSTSTTNKSISKTINSNDTYYDFSSNTNSNDDVNSNNSTSINSITTVAKNSIESNTEANIVNVTKYQSLTSTTGTYENTTNTYSSNCTNTTINAITTMTSTATNSSYSSNFTNSLTSTSNTITNNDTKFTKNATKLSNYTALFFPEKVIFYWSLKPVSIQS